MTHFVSQRLMLLILVVAGITMSASAQSDRMIKVNIPFEFTFAGKLFPAGQYTLVQPQQHVLVLQNAERKTAAQAFTQGVDAYAAAGSTLLKFDVREGQHSLLEVWHEQSPSGDRMFPTKSKAVGAKLKLNAPNGTQDTGNQP